MIRHPSRSDLQQNLSKNGTNAEQVTILVYFLLTSRKLHATESLENGA